MCTNIIKPNGCCTCVHTLLSQTAAARDAHTLLRQMAAARDVHTLLSQMAAARVYTHY